ncbi:MAG: TIGR02266 family protein [Deltaproteobacteria bacterium]|nr:TIGR02266 family protein [Deltaproteobacteria bacterium]
MDSPADRRVYPRLPLKLVVQFRLHDLQEFMREFAVNVSAGGMFIRSTDPYPKGAFVYLQFRLADGAKLIEGLAKVVHVNPPAHAVPGMGLEFVNLDAASQELIDRIVRERGGDAADPDSGLDSDAST